MNGLTTTLEVTGMTCGSCVRHVKQALERIDGVERAEVQLTPGRAAVKHRVGLTAQELLGAIEEEGYEACVLSAPS
ncbi:MAG: heavy metal-associated domain-containing protein [Polyangiaceae bacterium]